MKKTFLVIASLLLISISGFSQSKSNDVKLTINYEVLNTVSDKYSYVSKLVVYVDGVRTAESSPRIQTEPNSCTLNLSEGKHQVRAILEALYEGEWEERTLKNEYSLDLEWVETANFKKNRKVKITFDLDSGVKVKG
jgi:hypothetical protein